jgi:predicted transcriptional regulator
MPKERDTRERIVKILQRHGPLNSEQLGEIIGMRKTSAQALLGQMFRAGLVARDESRRPYIYRSL